MTIQQYREYVIKNNEIQCFGIKWRLLMDDSVVILNDIDNKVISNRVVITYKNFIDSDIQISSIINNLSITDINIILDPYKPHAYNLILDTRNKDKKEKVEGGIGAGMKYV